MRLLCNKDNAVHDEDQINGPSYNVKIKIKHLKYSET
jgi:hypothetical protein